ncbi:MAG: DUF350 domain-containing protein [Dehalococcoidia bacterium]|nr:DUF350 domain-containing protein [Dehalococcoidia bacterium]
MDTKLGGFMDNLLANASVSVIFSLLGFALLFIGYKVLDMLTPTKLSESIFAQGNMAAAIMAGSFIIGLALIIAQAVS